MALLDWKPLAIGPEDSLQTALATIDRGAQKLAVVADADGRLLGVVTDGDLRRGLLKGMALTEPVKLVMNATPTVGSPEQERAHWQKLLTERNLGVLPVVDANRRLLGLTTLASLAKPDPRSNWVVLMAGGMGQRLRPLTTHTPKPMLEVGGKPILESILSGFIASGFHQFFISVNYLSHIITDYFGDGSRWGVNIQYLRETQRMGTAGALSLLPAAPTGPLVLMNGDLLTRTDFGQLLDFHTNQQALATMAVREYEFQVPYGVVNTEGLSIRSLQEKPLLHFFVNAGMYALQPEAVAAIPRDTFFDITSLFDLLLEQGKACSSFPVRDYWLDIGQPADYQRAQAEYPLFFGSPAAQASE